MQHRDEPPAEAALEDYLKISRTPGTLRERVLHRLRNAIITNRLRPGDRLIERELCEWTGVSRTSVREALRSLEAEGLVRNIAYKGPVVATISADKARQLYEVRATLEGLAGQLCAERATDSVVERLSRVTDEVETHLLSNDVQLALDATTAFYDLLFEGCGNDELRDHLRLMQARITSLRAVSLSQRGRAIKSAAELRRIMQAIKARNPEKARLACVEHVENAAAAARETLTSLQAHSEDSVKSS